MQEACQRFEPADRITLRLHVDGHSCEEIAELIGKRDRTWVWRRLERIKERLREIFQSHWNGGASGHAEHSLFTNQRR